MLFANFAVPTFANTTDMDVIYKEDIKPSSADDGWLNFTYPSGETPDVSLEFKRDSLITIFTLEQILNYTKYENHTFPLYSFDYNETATVYGINPLYLLEVLGWADAGSINITSFDGNENTFNVSDIILSDGEFYKYTDASYSIMIGLAIEINDVMHWLDDFDAEETNEYFRVFGENIAENLKIKNVTTIEYNKEWKVDIVVDEEIVGFINTANSTSLGNYTTYDWGYSDEGYGWPDSEGTPVSCTGFTVESILDPFVDDNDFYEVSFIAFDGYGANKVFDQKDMVLGMDSFNNEGKQPILMNVSDGEQLGYYRGPFQFIAPGASKGNYIGGIVEIRVTVDDMNWYTPNLPSTAVPSTTINMTKNGVNSTYSLDDILMYNDINYHQIEISSMNISDTVEVFGFNPVHLLEVEGWGDAWTINISAADGHSSEFEMKDLLLRDPNFNKYSDNNATIVAFMVNNSGTMEWLADYQESNGDFRVYGDELEDNQKVKDVNQIILGDYWKVNVTLNGTLAGYFSSQNTTASVGDYESYDWGYSDEGYGWPNSDGDQVECSGFTLASIIATFVNDGDQNYSVSVIALDGYGGNKVFSKGDIEHGFINEDIDNENKIAILMNETEGDIVGYHRGPYQFIAPGLSKGSYIGLIVEVRVTLLPTTQLPTTTNTTTTNSTTTTTTTETKSSIPGFLPGFLVIASVSTILFITLRRRK
ncbi:hypothetical protein NEF87_005006 [Candidatus Lokiarchaeum ossiferum]|uniref:Uncharacterized protein n=1 Tax=Candidatus Lokiarchaeum ossiferum TaxID=2951803 RepID=A0ABY6I1P3_9ARCH|nr:hypothetical protein NEF87_005006 [Candidatus Lokiarchaeum sp. B-35]